MPASYQTLTAVVGTEACNARCPFCISKITLPAGAELPKPQVNWRNFTKACTLAKQAGTTTVLFTGKGEPTLYPDLLSEFLRALEQYNFPIIELQTNGIRIAEAMDKFRPYLQEWYALGMTTLAVSIVHYEPAKNREIYLPYRKSYIDLPMLIEFLHSFGLSVRLTCIMAKDYIDSDVRVGNLIDFAKAHKVEQLTVTPVNKPDEDQRNSDVFGWINEHHLPQEQLEKIVLWVESQGRHIMTLSHGAKVFDVGGQNLCLNNCLSVQPDTSELRNLIFMPDGHVRLYWQYPGSILF